MCFYTDDMACDTPMCYRCPFTNLVSHGPSFCCEMVIVGYFKLACIRYIAPCITWFFQLVPLRHSYYKLCFWEPAGKTS